MRADFSLAICENPLARVPNEVRSRGEHVFAFESTNGVCG